MAVDLEKYRKTSTTTPAVDLSKYKKAAPVEETVPEKSDGFLKSVAKAVVKLPVRVASSIASPIADAVGGFSQEDIARRNSEGRNILGMNIKPLGYQASAVQRGDMTAGEGAISMVKDVGGAALEAASYAVPIGKAKAVVPSALNAVRTGAVQGAKAGLVSGAAYGAGSELQNHESTLGSVAREAAIGGTIGGATGGVLGGVAGGLQQRFRPTSEQAVTKLESAYDDLFKATKSGANKLEKINDSGKSPQRFLAENGIVVDVTPDRKIDTKAAREVLFQKMDEIDEALTAGLKDSGKTVNLKDMMDEALTALDNTKTRADASVFDRQAQVRNIFDTYRKIYGDIVPLDIVNEIKRGQTGATKVFDATKPAFMRDVHYQVSKVARQTVEREAADLPVAELNKFYAEHIAAADILKKVNGNAVEGGRIGKYFARAAGATAGSIAGSSMGPLGSVGGAVVGDAVAGALQKSSATNKVVPPMVSRAIQQGTIKYGSKALDQFRNKARNPAATSIPTAAQTSNISPTLPEAPRKSRKLPTDK